MSQECECGWDCTICEECKKPQCECHCYDYLDDEDLNVDPDVSLDDDDMWN